MSDQLRHYEEGRIDLGSLLSSLDVLLACLETAEDTWIAQFRNAWAILEEIYAVALDKVEDGLSPNVETTINKPDNRGLITQATAKLRQLLEERIQKEERGGEEKTAM
jgi:hypothetical protein